MKEEASSAVTLHELPSLLVGAVAILVGAAEKARGVARPSRDAVTRIGVSSPVAPRMRRCRLGAVNRWLEARRGLRTGNCVPQCSSLEQ